MLVVMPTFSVAMPTFVEAPRVMFPFIVFAMALPAISSSALSLPGSPSRFPVLSLRGGAGTTEGEGGGGKQKFPKPSRPLSALKQSVLQPDDLWPSRPPPGDLDREHRGYLKPERQEAALAEAQRIPAVLHRIFFLGSQPHISQPQAISVMDPTMAVAFTAWEHQNQASGFRFALWNLADAEAYIAEHFQPHVLRAFQTLQPYAYKSDLFRYLVLYNEGGWYADLKLGMAESGLSLNSLLDRLALELGVKPEGLGFVGTGQNMVWNVPGAEGVMNAFLGAKPRHAVLGDTIVRIVDAINAGDKGKTPWSLTGPYALFVGLGKRQGDHKTWHHFQGGEGGVGLMRFGFDEWHLPASDHVLVRKASRGECGGGWAKIGGNNYVDMWFDDAVFKAE